MTSIKIYYVYTYVHTRKETSYLYFNFSQVLILRREDWTREFAWKLFRNSSFLGSEIQTAALLGLLWSFIVQIELEKSYVVPNSKFELRIDLYLRSWAAISVVLINLETYRRAGDLKHPPIQRLFNHCYSITSIMQLNQCIAAEKSSNGFRLKLMTLGNSASAFRWS